MVKRIRIRIGMCSNIAFDVTVCSFGYCNDNQTGNLLHTYVFVCVFGSSFIYSGADKSLARPTSRYILFDGENISFDASLVIYIYIYTHTHTHIHTYIHIYMNM